MDMRQLQHLTELKLSQSQAKLAKLLARENALRADLTRLRQMAQDTHAAPPEQAGMRAIGADVIWLRWVAEATRQLNVELAQVLAQKEGLMTAHRRAFGKDRVARDLVAREDASARKSRRDAELQRAMDQSLWE